MKNRVVALAGSHRRNGNTEIALQIIVEKLSSYNIDTEIIPLADKKIEFCKACDSCRKIQNCFIQDDLHEILGKMINAQGIILASPVYHFGITPLMSSFLIRATRVTHAMGGAVLGKEDYVKAYPHHSILKGKVGATLTIARRTGSSPALSNLNNFVLNNEMYLTGACYERVLFGYKPNDIHNDLEGIRNIGFLSENIAFLINKLFPIN